MKKITSLLLISFALLNVTHAQEAAKAVYVEAGGPGFLSVNYDMRFTHTQNGHRLSGQGRSILWRNWFGYKF